MRIACPNCGSTAQVRIVWQPNSFYGEETQIEYQCGCGCHFVGYFKFNVEISDNAYYPDIEAESEEAAMYIAVGWWMERNPDIHCEEVQEDA